VLNSAALGAAVAAAGCLAASPYLARLTLTVPDRDDRRWWRGRPSGTRRRGWTALTALVAGGLAGAAAGWTALLPALAALALVGTPLVVIDVEHHRLPDRLVGSAAVAAAALLALAAAVRGDWAAYLRAGEGATVVFAALFLLAFVAPRSFGFGDVKLGGVLGGYLGWTGWPAVYYGIFAGFLLGALLAVGLLLARRASRGSALAFGPMLLLGALLVLAVFEPDGSVPGLAT
jgi:leader peptidase (prepilin peptidase)/N-methyltransferase